MKRRLTPWLVAAILVPAVGIGALAQIGVITAQKPTSPLGQSDIVPFVRNGIGSVPSPYAAPGLIGAILNADKLTVAAGSSTTYTVPNGITLTFLNSTGTVTALTVTMAANPSDAQEYCFLSAVTLTGITPTANTGQSIVGTAVTAGVAGTSYCWRYISDTSTWYRLQ